MLIHMHILWKIDKVFWLTLALNQNSFKKNLRSLSWFYNTWNCAPWHHFRSDPDSFPTFLIFYKNERWERVFICLLIYYYYMCAHILIEFVFRARKILQEAKSTAEYLIHTCWIPGATYGILYIVRVQNQE